MSDHEYFVTGEDGGCLAIPTTEKLQEMIGRKFKDLYNRIDYLEKENNKLKDEHYKDQEIKIITEKYDNMRKEYNRGFPITKDEETKYKKWMEEHESICPGGHGVSGGKYTFKFLPTSIGTFGSVYCNSCKISYEFQQAD